MALNAKPTNADILALRRHLGLNQSEFWGPLGTTQSGGSRYESGREIPAPLKKLLLIAHGSESAAQKLVTELRQPKTPRRA